MVSRKYFLGIILCFFFLLTGCAANGSAESAKQSCEFVFGEAQAIYCNSFYSSLLLNVQEYNEQNNGAFFNSLGYQIDAEQGKEIFLAYLSRHPEDKTAPVFTVYLDAMSDFFKLPN